MAAHRVTLAGEDDFDGWRDAARGLAEAGVPASAVVWEVEGGEADLFGAGDATAAPAPTGASFSVPRDFVSLAKTVVCHRDPERFALLYAMLLKLRANKRALGDRADPLVDRLKAMEKEVRRDAHKMHAFVRFREVEDDDGERFVAWFEPDNHIVRREAGFFVRRFTNMRWSILTPELCIHWDGETLTQSPGATRADAPDGDPVEETWKTYYKSIFNPARVKVKAMTAEMPRKYWKNMPETAAIGELIAGAQAREAAMIEKSRSVPAAPKAPPPSNREAAWAALRDEAMGCTRCDLHCNATQTVFGEGPLDAKILFVGEQPGDAEDLAGRPFVGPAGQLFDEALAEAGIERASTYVTNAVKHFKFVLRGKRRIHQSPGAGEIQACNWWLGQERDLVRPPLTVTLGASAARAVFGKAVTIASLRGQPRLLADGSEAHVTVHPSYLLRLPDKDARRIEHALFVEDLRRVRERAEELTA
ncbi:UdgX family uracil-DNA binding protein [Sphingomicrobium nitratireducens]|uniref:UdgX family uracil-DNA binding protein n=1 Tax=Sphingomicrobium nitratireducens TaxID=2964666 RepID=UPI002240E133|nr:UdgX family uracil-DNA binding protein [Sphingomicrobium nitratireducens]